MAEKETLKTRIGDFLKDTVTLDVLTLTGTVKLTAQEADVPAVGDGAAKKSLDWDGLFAKITEQLKLEQGSEVEVVAYTHSEWDCDSVNYIKKGLGPEETNIVEGHNSAVESAHKSRFAALEFIGKVL